MTHLLEPTIQIACVLAALAVWFLILRRLERHKRPSDTVPDFHVGDTLISRTQAEKSCLKLRSINEGCYVPPSQGGCWFCYSDKGDMLFSTEFDTFFHLECLENAIAATSDDRPDQVAEFIARAFGTTSPTRNHADVQ